MHPKNLLIKDFTYNLPQDRIANFPLPVRDQSKLLIFKQGKIEEDIYHNLFAHIPENSLLIFNDTRVIEARIIFEKFTGGLIEIFCLNPHEQYKDIATALSQTEKVYWHCLIGGASKWKRGQTLEKKVMHAGKELLLQANFISKLSDNFLVSLQWNEPSLSFVEVLHAAGTTPIPPYIKRKATPIDVQHYQTVYAKEDGSVAAPTAGLHFTKSLFDSLAKKNISKEFVTLHVGAGTFKPVLCEQLTNHEMHSEVITVTIATIENLLQNLKKNIIAVGTTSLRTIESLYWMGVKIILKDPDPFSLSQWEIYELEKENISVEQSLSTLLTWMNQNGKTSLSAQTKIMIAPGYKTKIASALITNFHQPQSTLLLLIAALIGDEWKLVYEFALQNSFRFLSYGDGNLLWIKK